ncbi:amino acid ABC transporter permease [Pedococcus sp. 5OH_020]|uniref:amino acid ABC transporter permease n=1 Tax=Pedococcus sp. 5OH_020 TaxID=2989814 RepID=UPI0022E9E152|nr:amino acid ABC transporter permease [Pedococcus sp. 5OH_020]
MSSPSVTQAPPGYADEPVVRLRHPGRWVAAAVVVVLAAMFLHFVATTPQLRPDLVLGYLFERSILRGLLVTIELTAVAMVVGIVLGTLLAVMRLSDNPLLRWVAGGYVGLFRGTPILVQLLFWFFLGTVLPRVSLGVPFGPELVSVSTNTLITQFAAAILGLGLNEAAYMAEIVRAGIGAVDRGQTEAAQALGMSPGLSYRRVVLPQAARVIVPPTANELISMLKLTSLCLVIGLPELLTTAQLIYGRNFQQIPLLIVASIWYLVLTTLLSIVQARVERRMNRGVAGASPRRRTRPALSGVRP